MGGFLRSIKQRLIDCYFQDWHSKLMDSERFAIYRQYKETHNREKYLESIKIFKFRKALTRLRLGITELNGNKRFRNPLADFNCPFCNEEENEIHFLIKCPMYKNIRSKYIEPKWITLNTVTLKDLVQNEDDKITAGVAAYCYYASKLREESI